LAEGEQLRKVVEMFDPFGREVFDPAYYDQEGRLVRRTLGKAVILSPDGKDVGGRS